MLWKFKLNTEIIFCGFSSIQQCITLQGYSDKYKIFQYLLNGDVSV